MESKICIEEGCGGNINFSREAKINILIVVSFSIGCFPCEKCGRLHHYNGDGVTKNNRSKSPYFFINGKLKTKRVKNTKQITTHPQ